MRNLFVITSIILAGTVGTALTLQSCGRGHRGFTGTPGTSCTTSQVSTGAVIVCGDSVSHVYNGTAGSSCSTRQLSNGSETICSDGSRSVTLNGEIGPRGPQGEIGTAAPVTPYTITDVVLPCGPGGGYDEVLLRLGDGRLLAHFTEGSREFLSLLKPGTYATASQPACYFSVDVDNNLYDIHR